MRLDECENEGIGSISEYCKNLPERQPEETYVEYSMCVWDYRTEDRSRMVMLMKVVVRVNVLVDFDARTEIPFVTRFFVCKSIYSVGLKCCLYEIRSKGGFFVPLIIICICYTVIIVKARRMQMATRMTAASNHMSKMIVAVVVSFFGKLQYQFQLELRGALYYL